jgi:hypothetical protein
MLEVLTDSLLLKKTLSYGCQGEILKETESEIIAVQDQALQTKYHATKILQTNIHKTRLCKK